MAQSEVQATMFPARTAVAGGVVIAVGLYELTPLKRHCRQRCRESVRSGVGFGMYCVGSSVGLMLMLVVLGVMSLTWMVVATVLVVGQKLLPARGRLPSPNRRHPMCPGRPSQRHSRMTVALKHMTREVEGESPSRTPPTTRAFRRENGEWRLILRHANLLSPDDESRERELQAG